MPFLSNLTRMLFSSKTRCAVLASDGAGGVHVNVISIHGERCTLLCRVCANALSWTLKKAKQNSLHVYCPS